VFCEQTDSIMGDEHAHNEAEGYAVAVGLLARREHSARELVGKLTSRGFAETVIESVLGRLQAERLQSDERYAEVYLRQRSDKGYGPERIRAEMRERGIDDGLISASFRRAEEEGEVDWFERAATVYGKKFGERPIEDIKDRAKRQRFMQYRGFSHEQIAEAIAYNHSNSG
jgi:regulatory protein